MSNTRKRNPLEKAVRNPSFKKVSMTLNVVKYNEFKAACIKYSGSEREISLITRRLMEQFTDGVNSGAFKKHKP